MSKKMKKIFKGIINVNFLIFLIVSNVYSQSSIQRNGNETFYTYGSYRIDGTEIYLSPDGNAGSAGYYFIINQRPISAQICFNYYDDGMIDDSRVIKASSDNTNWREIGRLPKNSQNQCFDLAPNSDFSNNGSLYIDVYAAPNASLHLRSLTLTYTLNSPPNTPTFYIAPPTGNTNTPVSFSVGTSDPNNDRIRYKWDWDGNGSVDETSDYYASGTNVTFTHTWNIPGNYTVRVKAQDERGAESNWASTPIEIVTYYSIWGYVRDGNNNPIRDVGIQVSDNDNIYMRSTDANGYYSVENIRSGHSIIITPQKTGCSFTPSNRTYNNISSNQSNQNFTANCNRSPVIGTLSASTTQLNVGQSGNFTISATDADGDQVKYKWDWNGDGVVDEESNYYNSGDIRSFSHSWNTPGTYQVKVKAQDSRGAESSWSNSLSVTVNPVQYYISGKVTDTNNNPMRGIQIELRQNTLEGSLIGTTVTDSNGNYSFTNLNPGTYYFRPTTPNYNYSPTYWSCTLNTNGRYCTGNFMVTPQLSSISGYVRDSLNNGVSDVQINYYRNGVYIGTYWSTNSQGYYSIDNLANGTYKIEPVRNGVSFNPAFRDNIGVPPSQTNINFTAFTNRSPIIGTLNGPTQLNVGQSGNFIISATDADGDQVKYKWDWNGDGVVDEESNYYNSGDIRSFSHSWNTPGTYQVKVKAQDSKGAESSWSNTLTVNVVGNIPYYSISGYVRDSNNNPIKDVGIEVSDNNTFYMRSTDVNGYYSVENIIAGHNVIITPQKTGCSFTPSNRTYNNISSNQSNQNFTANCCNLSKPSNFQALPLQNSIVLSWNAVNGASGYEIERCEGFGCNNFTGLKSVDPITSFKDTTAKPDTLYSYRIRSVNNQCRSDYSIIQNVSFILNPIVPPTQKEIILTNPTDGSVISYMPITFQWQPVEGVKQYRITISETQLTQDPGQGIFFQTSTNDNTFRYDSTQNQSDYRKCLSNGDYWWKVEGLDANGSIIASSINWYKLRIQTPTPLCIIRNSPQLTCTANKFDNYRYTIKCEFPYSKVSGDEVILVFDRNPSDPFPPIEGVKMSCEGNKCWGTVITDLSFSDKVKLYAQVTNVDRNRHSFTTSEVEVNTKVNRDLCENIKIINETWGCNRYEEIGNLRGLKEQLENYRNLIKNSSFDYMIIAPIARPIEYITGIDVKKVNISCNNGQTYYDTGDLLKKIEIIEDNLKNCLSCRDKFVEKLLDPKGLTITLTVGGIELLSGGGVTPIVSGVITDTILGAVETCGCKSDDCRLTTGMIRVLMDLPKLLEGKPPKEQVSTLAKRLKELGIKNPTEVAQSLLGPTKKATILGGISLEISDDINNILVSTSSIPPGKENPQPLKCFQPEENIEDNENGEKALGITLNCNSNIDISDIKSNIQVNNIKEGSIGETVIDNLVPMEVNRIEDPLHQGGNIKFKWKIPYNKKGFGSYQLSRKIVYTINIDYQNVHKKLGKKEIEILKLSDYKEGVTLNINKKSYPRAYSDDKIDIGYTVKIDPNYNRYRVQIPLYIGICDASCNTNEWYEKFYMSYMSHEHPIARGMEIGRYINVTDNYSDSLEMPSSLRGQGAQVCIWDRIDKEKVKCVGIPE